jgi:hypothetical protein
VKRININYGGEHYTLADADPELIKAEITEALVSGKPFWLRVNHGEGTVRAADLLITAGTAISLIAIEPSGPTDSPFSSTPLAVGPSDASATTNDTDDELGLSSRNGFHGLDAR